MREDNASPISTAQTQFPPVVAATAAERSLSSRPANGRYVTAARDAAAAPSAAAVSSAVVAVHVGRRRASAPTAGLDDVL